VRKIPAALLIIAAAAFIGSVWYGLGRRVVRGEYYSPYSSYRSDAFGTRRLYLFYEDAGFEPDRLKSELVMLEEPGILFVIEPASMMLPAMVADVMPEFGTFMERELDAIVSWVSAGNVLVLAGSHGTELHERLGLSVQPGASGRTRNAPRTQLSPLTRRIRSLRARRSGGLELEDASWVELFATEEEQVGLQPLAAVRQLGEGVVVAVSDPYVFTNNGVKASANLMFAVQLAGLAGGTRVYFDEYHHGFSDPRTIVSYVRERGFQFALLQALGVFVLFAWRARMRLGTPKRLSREVERGSAEYVRAFSLIYRRAGLHASVIRSAYASFCEEVGLWAGIGRDADRERISEALGSRDSRAAAQFKVISTRAKVGGYGGTDAQVLAFMRMVAAFEKEFLHAERGTRRTS
jgi:hypothetical protein